MCEDCRPRFSYRPHSPATLEKERLPFSPFHQHVQSVVPLLIISADICILNFSNSLYPETRSVFVRSLSEDAQN